MKNFALPPFSQYILIKDIQWLIIQMIVRESVILTVFVQKIRIEFLVFAQTLDYRRHLCTDKLPTPLIFTSQIFFFEIVTIKKKSDLF